MKTLKLHGFMAEKYGSEFQLAASTPRELIKALAVQLPGFDKDVRDGEWHVVRGDLDDAGFDQSYNEESVGMQLPEGEVIHLIPALAAAGNGAFQTILGIVLIVVGAIFYYTPFGTPLIATGAGLLVGGIIQMTTKIPGTDTNQEGANDRASFLFTGPKNQSTQGVAIPRGYGRCRVGSVVISVGLYARKLTEGSTP